MLYTIQNNVIYTALSHLDAVTFQIVYQMKIVAAAFAHRFLLGKHVSGQKWLSVLLLTIGVPGSGEALKKTAPDATNKQTDMATFSGRKFYLEII